MRPPIFIFDGHDLTFCESVAEAKMEIEIYDVDEYEVFDVDGRQLKARVVEEPDPRQWEKLIRFLSLTSKRIELVDGGNHIADEQQLQSRIRLYLMRHGVSEVELSGMSAEELVETIRRLRR